MIRFTWLKALAMNELPFISGNGSLTLRSFNMSGWYGLNFLYFIPSRDSLFSLNSSFSARFLYLVLVSIGSTPSIKYNDYINFFKALLYRVSDGPSFLLI